MELASISKSELFPGKIFLLLLFSAFLAALHMLCLSCGNGGCSAFVAVPGASRSISDANVASSYNDNIYEFTSVHITSTPKPDVSGSDDDLHTDILGTHADASTTYKSLYNSKFRGDHDDLLTDAFADASTTLKPLYNSKFRGDEHLIFTNLKLKNLWTSKDWRNKVSTFTDIFSDLMKRNLLKPCVKALCIGAGQGHEVLALKEMGIYNSIGIDLVAAPPLVMKGDMHSQPFRKETFDFEFCNVFDHALLTSKFAAEIERTLKPGGCVVIHLMLKNRSQEACRLNNLQNVAVLIAIFSNFDTLHIGDIDAFGLDTEVIFRKPLLQKKAASVT